MATQKKKQILIWISIHTTSTRHCFCPVQKQNATQISQTLTKWTAPKICWSVQLLIKKAKMDAIHSGDYRGLKEVPTFCNTVSGFPKLKKTKNEIQTNIAWIKSESIHTFTWQFEPSLKYMCNLRSAGNMRDRVHDIWENESTNHLRNIMTICFLINIYISRIINQSKGCTCTTGKRENISSMGHKKKQDKNMNVTNEMLLYKQNTFISLKDTCMNTQFTQIYQISKCVKENITFLYLFFLSIKTLIFFNKYEIHNNFPHTCTRTHDTQYFRNAMLAYIN